MDKITIVFWSQGGNTAAMATAVAEGVKAAGREAEIVPVSEASLDELKAADAFAMGCPAMGAEALEEYEMEPFVADVENFVSGKKIALFGSYGWGDGEWIRTWAEDAEAAGARLVVEPVMANGSPDGDAETACAALGTALANA